MTVIAWDGTTLAADRRAVSVETPRRVCKIREIRGHLCATSGDFAFGLAMFQWFADGAMPGDYPQSQRDKDDWQSLLIITPERKIWRFERTPYPIEILDKQYAMGSGRDYALMAMHLGKTAVEAVELTSLFNVYCGDGVDTLTLP